jgi:hypothetical protein
MPTFHNLGTEDRGGGIDWRSVITYDCCNTFALFGGTKTVSQLDCLGSRSSRLLVCFLKIEIHYYSISITVWVLCAIIVSPPQVMLLALLVLPLSCRLFRSSF